MMKEQDMALPNGSTLERLGETNLTVADPRADVRERKVIDAAGDEVGKVDDLLIDDSEARVRMLRVEHPHPCLGVVDQQVVDLADLVAGRIDHLAFAHVSPRIRDGEVRLAESLERASVGQSHVLLLHHPSSPDGDGLPSQTPSQTARSCSWLLLLAPWAWLRPQTVKV